MSHEKDGKEKSGKKTPTKTLKEKRAAKAAKRIEKSASRNYFTVKPVTKPEK